MDKSSLIFMGTPDFAVPTLKALLEAGHPIKAVYTQPPRPVGRGYETRPSSIHRFALEHHLNILTPLSLKDPQVQSEFHSFQADFVIVAAYGLLLPEVILKAPMHGCINVHASLLPRWRGAAPLQRAILAGDSKTGVTIMQMEKGLDTGPIIVQEEIKITPQTTAKSLQVQVAHLGADLILPALEGLLTGSLVPHPQPSEGVTYAPKMTKEEARIDWRQAAVSLERQVRAFIPWPGAYFEWQGQKIKILQASYEPLSHTALPGELLDDHLLIACGMDALRLLEIQRPGKSPLKAKEFLNGISLIKGLRLDCIDGPL